MDFVFDIEEISEYVESLIKELGLSTYVDNDGNSIYYDCDINWIEFSFADGTTKEQINELSKRIWDKYPKVDIEDYNVYPTIAISYNRD
jgi:hypothetical protein